MLYFKEISESELNSLDLNGKIILLQEIINYNNNIYNNMQNELNIIKKILDNSNFNSNKKEDQKTVQNNHNNNKYGKNNNQTFTNSGLKYIRILEAMDFDNLDDEDIYDAIVDILPSKNIENFRNIINCILLEFEKIKKEYSEIIFSSSLEDKQLFSIEYQKIVKIQAAIIEYRDKEIKSELFVDNNNNNNNNFVNQLVFLKNYDGEIFIKNDFDNISIEYYQSFQKILESLIDGTYIYKNWHHFRSINKKLSGDIIIVKGFKTRIIFQKIGLNKFLILGAFIKKTNQNTKSVNNIINIKSRIDSLISSNYVSEDLDMIMNFLKQKGRKVKTKCL